MLVRVVVCLESPRALFTAPDLNIGFMHSIMMPRKTRAVGPTKSETSGMYFSPN
jgi:hypothetical protein